MEIFKTRETESSQVMLEKISKVFKLVAVEAQVSEIYDYKQYRYWDINLLRKKALVRVAAKVSLGYDFDDVEFVVDEENRIITMKNFPEAEILSIEHDVDYFDMEEGLFNSFSGDDLTELNRRAKQYAVDMIEKSELYKQADEQKSQILEMLAEIFSLSGWELEAEGISKQLKN